MLRQDKTAKAYSKNWSFDRYNEWPAKYPQCGKSAKTTAPINIDTNNVSPCRALCKFAAKYAPSGCNVTIKNNMPIVIFDPTCIIKFRSEFFYLRKMSIHYPSMHTVNGETYDMEVLLYHNRNKKTDEDGGVIISILFKKGDDFGSVNEFFNEFINQMPSNENTDSEEIEVPVSDTWTPEKLFPESKSFFWYEGALPFPPCSNNWNIIVFEEIQSVSQNIIDTVRYVIGTENINTRGVQKKPPTVTVFYNTDTEFTTDDEVNKVRPQTAEIITELDNARKNTFVQRNYLYIKGFLIGIIVLLMIYVAIKLAKYIVANDLLNIFIVEQVIKRNKRVMDEQKQAAIESGQMNASGGMQGGMPAAGNATGGMGDLSALLGSMQGAAPASANTSTVSSTGQQMGLNPFK